MGQIAFCFPGQGSQELGMGAAMAAAYPEARAVYDRASAVLGYDLAEVCFEGPLERLSATEVTQPALLATSIACLAVVRAAGYEADVVVGHSVGEYAALVASGALSEADGITLVRERGLATAEAAAASPGAMAAVIGLADEEVERLCAGIEGVWPANYNCPGQLVVSGTRAGVEALVEAATAAGARRAMLLKVAGGFHSPLTATAEARLRPAVDAVSFAEPTTPFFSTTTCDLEGAGTIPDMLVAQLSAPVRFTQSVTELVRRGTDVFIELGAGSVLSGLIKRIDRGVTAVSVSGPDHLARLKEIARG